jgi:hypothetical protein
LETAESVITETTTYLEASRLFPPSACRWGGSRSGTASSMAMMHPIGDEFSAADPYYRYRSEEEIDVGSALARWNDGGLRSVGFGPGGRPGRRGHVLPGLRPDAGAGTGTRTELAVYTYDRRGRGDRGDTAPYAVAREVEDLAAVIEEAGGSAYVYGISSGAALALEAAASGLPIISSPCTTPRSQPRPGTRRRRSVLPPAGRTAGRRPPRVTPSSCS